ncbi:Ankyrin repeat [Geosmithia morbida]|uniref:Ankyrin repeat n=1 Tax=Geosmithia morbida TaxID=1094350 RepID=A0A9P4YRB8_9HYPO|nr:Ankyrin repeat [Geosmithia morbida]KAF4121688.1 Ankyrin repeat [Geosmithia morbida]
MAETGRPSLWDSSSLRKLTRLYEYTLLDLDTILTAIWHYCPNKGAKPSPESANKKLKALLDKQPRWTRPGNEEDVEVRYEQYRQSYAATAAASPDFAVSSSESPRAQEWDGCYLPLDSCTSEPQQHGREASRAFVDADPFSPSTIARTATNLSDSTDVSTGSRELFSGHSSRCIHIVKRLIKRLTIHATSDFKVPTSGSSPFTSWTSDPDAAHPLTTVLPPLPGDFLLIDFHKFQKAYCFSQPQRCHMPTCICRALTENLNLAWVGQDGPTPLAREILNGRFSSVQPDSRDVFGNTPLHLLAVRGRSEVLLHAVRHQRFADFLGAANTAGQTFLHTLHPGWFAQASNIYALLDALTALPHLPSDSRLDLSARDHFATRYSLINACRSRDALGVVPLAFPIDRVSSSQNPEYAYNDLIKVVTHASQNPHIQDDHGRNGLHCLAAAPMCPGSYLARRDRIDLLPPAARSGGSFGRAKAAAPQEEEIHKSFYLDDSSQPVLTLRMNTASSLLDAKVDVNDHDADGNTPLMAFCAELPEDGDDKVGRETIRLLVTQGGANVNARNRRGETALHVAVRCGRKLAVRELVDLGANVHCRDADGRGLLALADVKIAGAGEGPHPFLSHRSPSSPPSPATMRMPFAYAHYQACRAYLSKPRGISAAQQIAVQHPSLGQEWGMYVL